MQAGEPGPVRARRPTPALENPCPLDSAKAREIVYEKQDEEPGTQTVRVYGDTAVVTALLWLKGLRENKPFERRLWFSDAYVRTPKGWKYVFGQASLPLP